MLDACRDILIVDDDLDLLDLLELKLGKEGFWVIKARNGEDGLNIARAKRPSLVVLDVNMPRMNGMDVCKSLKSDPVTRNIPVIMLTVKNEEIDRILGFEFGADDYVTKPFNTRELALRVKGILKRVYGPDSSSRRTQVGDLMIDMDNHEVRVANRRVDLTTKEFKLLTCLMEKPGQVKSREFLLDHIWEYNDRVFSRTVDTHIQRLRSKLKSAGKRIETVRGVGYRISA